MIVLDKIFHLSKNNTSIKTEVLAGLITFLTMSYIIFVTPIILQSTGINITDAFIATCLVSAFGALLMAFYANLPLALAPGMGLNALFTYTIIFSMGYSWQNALAITFIAGIMIIIIILFLSKDFLINSIPTSLKFAVTAGIGMFVTLIALENAGIVVDHSATLVSLAKFNDPKLILIVLSFFILIVSSLKRIYIMPLLIIILLTIFNIYSNEIEFNGIINNNIQIPSTFLAMDFSNIFHMGLLSIIIVVFFACFFDSFGALISYSYFLNPNNPKLDNKKTKKSLLIAGISCTFAGILGTSPVSIFLESNSGISFGGRTGLTSLIIGILFLLSIFFSPLINYVPIWASSPILLYLGISMMMSLKNIDWEDATNSIPSIICVTIMPFSYSVTMGIASAFVSYAILKLLTNKRKEVPMFTWILSFVFLISFII